MSTLASLGTSISSVGLSSLFGNIMTDGISTWRINARDGELAWDYEITATGFNGIEDTDWYNAQSIESP